MASREQLERLLAVRNVAIDRLAADVAGEFAEAGIESVVLKGPVLAHWLYPGEVRPYGDADLLVSPGRWDEAVAVLTALGFADRLGPMAHPRMESFAGTAFIRGGQDEDNLDLHCAIHGLDADPAEVWRGFSSGGAVQSIGGADLRVPERPALALHVALHAAHHTEAKPVEDLRRALAIGDDALWARAWELARALDGEATFASGLRRLPAGAELAERLGIGAEVRSSRHDIRHRQVPMAEGIDELLAPGQGLGGRLRVVAQEFFPRPDFMRWWSPLARRGPLGLALSYPWRWLYLLWNAPRGLRAARRGRRG